NHFDKKSLFTTPNQYNSDFLLDNKEIFENNFFNEETIKTFRTKVTTYFKRSENRTRIPLINTPEIQTLFVKEVFLSKEEIKTFNKKDFQNKIKPIITIDETLKDKEKVEQRLKVAYDLLIERNLIPICIYLQGSQNYELDTVGSDIDLKSIVLNLNYFSKNSNEISATIKMGIVEARFGETQEEFLEVKHINKMLPTILKMNPSYIEFIYSKAFLTTPITQPILDLFVENKDNILNHLFIQHIEGLLGFLGDKIHSLNKEYESKKFVLQNFGYDPKQLHHMYRINLQIANYLKNNKNDFPFNWESVNNITLNNQNNHFKIEDKEYIEHLIDIKSQPIKKEIDEVNDIKQKWLNQLNQYYTEIKKYKIENAEEIEEDLKIITKLFDFISSTSISLEKNLQKDFLKNNFKLSNKRKENIL
ncbi:MAG: hypothetical protein ACRC4M_00710, partial [Mycoplasma sp.]